MSEKKRRVTGVGRMVAKLNRLDARGNMLPCTQNCEGTPVPNGQELAPVGRNEPCPCGSGKKFKLCCAAKQAGQKAPEPEVIQTLAAGAALGIFAPSLFRKRKQ